MEFDSLVVTLGSRYEIQISGQTKWKKFNVGSSSRYQETFVEVDQRIMNFSMENTSAH
jgi:hypothetical protein